MFPTLRKLLMELIEIRTQIMACTLPLVSVCGWILPDVLSLLYPYQILGCDGLASVA